MLHESRSDRRKERTVRQGTDLTLMCIYIPAGVFVTENNIRKCKRLQTQFQSLVFWEEKAFPPNRIMRGHTLWAP